MFLKRRGSTCSIPRWGNPASAVNAERDDHRHWNICIRQGVAGLNEGESLGLDQRLMSTSIMR
jgi:hypothetical protein